MKVIRALRTLLIPRDPEREDGSLIELPTGMLGLVSDNFNLPEGFATIENRVNVKTFTSKTLVLQNEILESDTENESDDEILEED